MYVLIENDWNNKSIIEKLVYLTALSALTTVTVISVGTLESRDYEESIAVV